MTAGGDWRVGDGEREAVATALGMHLAAGRLSMGEFRSRLDAVYAAATARELAEVTADLPAAGFGPPAGAPGPAARDDAAALLSHGRRAVRRLLAVAASLLAAGFAGFVLLVAAMFGHGSLLTAGLVLLFAPVALAALAAGSLVWLGRRAWRSGAWLEVVPAAAGVPWAGRAAWALRVLVASRVFVRIARAAGRPLRRSGRRGQVRAGRQATAWYQDEPGGDWRRARVEGLDGTGR